MTQNAECDFHTAVFDLDATLTRFDTFQPFVFGYVRYARKSRTALILRLLPLLLVAWRWADFTWWKHRILAALFAGDSPGQIREWTTQFARDVVNDGLRADGVAQLRRHQAGGVRVVLASASIDLYVQPIAQELGIEEVLATPTARGSGTGMQGLAGANCRDVEKLRRVRALSEMPADGVGVIAYSDSHADIPLLEWAETGVAVWPSRRLQRQVDRLQLTVAYWS